MRHTTGYLVALVFFVGLVLISFYQVPPTNFEKNFIFFIVLGLLSLAIFNDGK